MEKHFRVMFENFQSYKNRELFCDVVLKAENKSYHVHKILLSAASEYFKNLFGPEGTNRQVVECREVTSSALEVCLQYIYCGEVELANSTIENVLNAACLFKLWKLKDMCFAFIEKHLTVDNCLRYYQLSKKFISESFQNIAFNFICKNSEEILESADEYCHLEVKNIEELLKSDNLMLRDEMLAYKALVRWIKYDENRRKKYFCDLFQHIRLPIMSKDDLSLLVNDSWVRDCPKSKDYGLQSLVYQIRSQNDNLKPFQIRKRCKDMTKNKKIKEIVIIATTSGFKSFSIEKQDFVEQPAIHKCEFQSFFNSIANFNGKLFAMGAPNNKRAFVCDYDVNNGWEDLPEMTMVNQGNSSGTIVHGNKIYVISGNCAENNTKCVHCFNTETHNWKMLPGLTTPRTNMALAVLGDYIYAIGGINRGKTFNKNSPRKSNDKTESDLYLSSVERFNTLTIKWSQVAPLNSPRINAVAEEYLNYIFTMGGQMSATSFPISSVELYNEDENVWTIVSSMNFTRSCFGACIHDDQLFVFGGISGDKEAVLCERWNSDTKKWEICTKVLNTVGACKVFCA